MLYNLDWLKEGQVFPPKSEWERLKTYQDNESLFKGDVSEVLRPYCKRLQTIVDRFSTYCGFSPESIDRFEIDLNYWQLMTLKTGDLITGEPPSITSNGVDLDAQISETGFDEKLLTAVYDVSRFGDSIARLKKDKDGRKNFVISSPSMWFPVVSQEDPDDILYHVIAWPECLNPTAEDYQKKYVIKAQVHERGKYTPLTFEVKAAKVGLNAENIIMNDGLNVTLDSFLLGACVDAGKPVKTGYNDFAIIQFHNTRTSNSIFGINDYDRITPIVAELQVRYSLESLILDKHSAPTISAPTKSLNQTKNGEWYLPLGGVIATEPGDQPPAYVVWDAAFQANHTMIEKLENHLFSLCELGAIINDDAFGASQGFEALETRMTNARLKARRMSSAFRRSLKKLVSAITDIAERDISICWNDGLPNNEYRETEIATKKVQGKLFDLETVLKDHFDKTEEEAKRIAVNVARQHSNTFTRYDEEDEEDEDEDGEGDGFDDKSRKKKLNGDNDA